MRARLNLEPNISKRAIVGNIMPRRRRAFVADLACENDPAFIDLAVIFDDDVDERSQAFPLSSQGLLPCSPRHRCAIPSHGNR